MVEGSRYEKHGEFSRYEKHGGYREIRIIILEGKHKKCGSFFSPHRDKFLGEFIKMTQIDTTAQGNTSKPSRSRKWVFTLNNYSMTHLTQIKNSLKSEQYVIGEEVAPKTGTKHLQGFIEFRNARHFDGVKQILGKEAHIEKARGTAQQNIAYCGKEGNVHSNLAIYQQQAILEKRYKDVIWREWQQRVLEFLDMEPDSRTIFWITDEKGNSGKSYLTKYLAMTREGVILASGKRDNIFNQINRSITERNVVPQIILVDVPRCNYRYVSYSAIEEIKNGLIYSGKYEGGQCIFDHPHVIVFSNEDPDLEMMSQDRWFIYGIVGEEMLLKNHRM